MVGGDKIVVSRRTVEAKPAEFLPLRRDALNAFFRGLGSRRDH